MATDDSKNAESPTVGQRLDRAIETTRERIGNVATEAKEKWSRSKEALSDLRKKNMDDVITSAKEFAKEHPGTTLFAGVALGFLVGYMVRGRRD